MLLQLGEMVCEGICFIHQLETAGREGKKQFTYIYLIMVVIYLDLRARPFFAHFTALASVPAGNSAKPGGLRVGMVTSLNSIVAGISDDIRIGSASQVFSVSEV